MIEHRHVSFVLAVVKVAKRDVTAVRSLPGDRAYIDFSPGLYDVP